MGIFRRARPTKRQVHSYSVYLLDFQDYSQRPLVHTNGKKWYEFGYNETSSEKLNQADQIYLGMHKKAEKLLKRDVELHEKCKFILEEGGLKRVIFLILVTKVDKKSEEAWLSTVIEKGTMGDRLSAAQLKFQQAPVHSLEYLDRVVALFEKKKMRDSLNMFSNFNQHFSRFGSTFRMLEGNHDQRFASAQSETGFVRHGSRFLPCF